MKTRVMVYGTLKRNHMRGHVLKDQTHLGDVKTEPKYKLFDLGSFPGIMVAKGEGNAIEGEVYEVDEACLNQLDRIEGHPRLFKRDKIEIPLFEDVYAYFWQHEEGEDIGSCWKGA